MEAHSAKPSDQRLHTVSSLWAGRMAGRQAVGPAAEPRPGNNKPSADNSNDIAHRYEVSVAACLDRSSVRRVSDKFWPPSPYSSDTSGISGERNLKGSAK